MALLTPQFSKSNHVVKTHVPQTRADDVVETLHGVKVHDPYRWLENAANPEVQKWVEEQNQYTLSILGKLPNREAMHRRLMDMASMGSIGLTVPKANRFYFFTRRQGTENQPVLYVREGLHGPERALINPNTLSQEGIVALDWWYPSNDGKLLAYGLSEKGNEISTLYVMDVATGRNLSEKIPFARFASVAWKRDGSGFFYTRNPAPGAVTAGDENYFRRVFEHELGRDYKKDPLLFGEGRDKSEIPICTLSPDGRYLLVNALKGSSDNGDLYFMDLKNPSAKFVPIAEKMDAAFFGEVLDGILYLRTNYKAPRYRLLKVDLAHPDPSYWTELIPEGKSLLVNAGIVQGKLFCTFLENATSHIKVYSLEGKPEREIRLPALGTVSGVSGEWDGQEAFFHFQNFFTPAAIYRVDAGDLSVSLYDSVKSTVDSSPYIAEQVWYTSKDGTKVSMFVVHKKGIKLDGTHPTMLTGYGGFNISETPVFSYSRFYWLEHGGIYAVANLRGGGEYGEQWHEAGMLGKKQNVFDDFIAAAEYLIQKKYTTPRKLAILGGSNGGLLMGAMMTQRPELFKAIICAVPLLDMIRYHQFLIARFWIPEYGSSDDPKQFLWLYRYSPYHHVRKGTKYPAILLTASESDGRVDPLHARKMTALLQASTASDPATTPILLRLETKAGHGAGKPLSKQIDEVVDEYSFLIWQLGMK